MQGYAKKTLLIGLTTLCSFAASANNFNYNTFEIRMGASPSTFGGEFTTLFTQNAHFIGRVDTGFESDWDAAGGIGFNGPIGQFADIYGQMLLHNIERNDDNSFKTEVNVGVKAWLMANIEVNARLGQLIDNDGTNSIVGFGARFHSTEQLSVGVDMRNNGTYGHQVLMSARFGF
ncbi:hypothetical protein QTO05_18815 [Vibrio fortis]|jgi:hypothetical protein|uniref:Outer membrane protein beta-barrel domain-containing protein n=1 Tax=Vibrio fortis TaxID=212667 RepID=A0A066USK4_9VIBR|nr:MULTISPECIES: hypothetical protein [Vibrio]KAB0289252.1 hypothetical protein F2P58_09220 [Vibrio fortis]KAB0300639.1 hypothetical protein F2Z80_16055 [Vibrio fortis]KDN27153.1 hypothetical protein VFDL14_19800 [Vibrio fortis]MDK9760786.1 hypothetical protein [Vibrio sp. D420a]QFT12671.1 hypothetical protein FIV04_22310 [Vibrio sp. THAF190c]